jgi:hypothetical protein
MGSKRELGFSLKLCLSSALKEEVTVVYVVMGKKMAFPSKQIL